MSHRCSGKAWLGPRSQLKPPETPQLCGAPCLPPCLTWFHAFSKCKIRTPPPDVWLRLCVQLSLGPQTCNSLGLIGLNSIMGHFAHAHKLKRQIVFHPKDNKAKFCCLVTAARCFWVIITHHLLLFEFTLSNRPCVFPHTRVSPHVINITKLCN